MNKLLQMLTSDGIISSELASAICKDSRLRHMDMQTYLILRDIITEQALAAYLAGKYGLSVADPDDYPIDPQALNTLPPQLVRKREILPVGVRGGRSLIVVVSDPTNIYAIYSAQEETSYNFLSVSVAPKMSLMKAIAVRYGLEGHWLTN